MKFTNEPLYEIFTTLKKALTLRNTHETIEFEVLNPDLCDSTYAGTIINIDKQEYIYRGLKAYNDLCELLNCKMLLPVPKEEKTVLMRFKKLNSKESFHLSEDSTEKYGTTSHFSKIEKNEEPAFLAHYVKALENVKIDSRLRILNLGVNTGEEFRIIEQITSNFNIHELIGIDYSHSAINQAKKNFSNSNITFIQHDINNLSTLNLGEFDLIISIGTLQSSNLEFNPLFMSIVQNYLKKEGAMILGFPNCRWVDGEMIYGAEVKNYNFSELGNLYKDVMFCKKYLQQKKFRVTITGKNYIFLTATSIR